MAVSSIKKPFKIACAMYDAKDGDLIIVKAVEE